MTCKSCDTGILKQLLYNFLHEDKLSLQPPQHPKPNPEQQAFILSNNLLDCTLSQFKLGEL